MGQTISVPLWLVILGSVFAVIAFFSHFLFPSVRWFFRGSTNKMINKVNERLPFQIPKLALTKRAVLIDRLVYDPKVLEAASAHSEDTGEPMDVTMEKVERYAREVIPSFNAKVYFQFGDWLCRKIIQMLYRVRLGYSAEDKLKGIDKNASIVLVMNHRSNVDYILVAYLAMQQTALSYAVGEWARVWPLQPLIKSLGAYFVRRGSGNPLYRRVLERYVQMAIDGGVVQAVFPEGGLSQDGNFRKPKIGLLDYMIRNFDPAGERDIVFVPIGLNYDRVLEDKNLLSKTDPNAAKRSGRAVIFTIIGFVFKNFWLMIRRKWYRYGYAAANFGEPVSLKSYLTENNWEPKELSRDDRFERVQELADDLIESIADVIPVLPVSLVSTIFLQNPDTDFSMEELQNEVEELGEKLNEDEAHVYIPRNDPEYGFEVGLRMLILRGMVLELGEEHGHPEKTYKLNPTEREVVEYYANSIRYLVEHCQHPNELIA